jgi:RNA recognition motif-containing protein
MKKLFVGSLPWAVNDERLAELFAEAGTVESANVVLDKMTGRSRGFGFVEMSTVEEAQKAVEVLNGREVEGRTIIVSEAKPQVDRR